MLRFGRWELNENVSPQLFVKVKRKIALILYHKYRNVYLPIFWAHLPDIVENGKYYLKAANAFFNDVVKTNESPPSSENLGRGSSLRVRVKRRPRHNLTLLVLDILMYSSSEMRWAQRGDMKISLSYVNIKRRRRWRTRVSEEPPRNRVVCGVEIAR